MEKGFSVKLVRIWKEPFSAKNVEELLNLCSAAILAKREAKVANIYCSVGCRSDGTVAVLFLSLLIVPHTSSIKVLISLSHLKSVVVQIDLYIPKLNMNLTKLELWGISANKS